MMYAIQGNNIRWFFTPEEEKHLFSDFTDYVGSAEVVVRGNWNEGLIFSPVIRKGRPSTDLRTGSFPILTVAGDDNGDNIKTIVIPMEYLKISRQFINNIKQTGIVRCRKADDRHEITVYPQIVEYTKEQMQEIAKHEEVAAQEVPEMNKPVADAEVKTVDSTVTEPPPQPAAASDPINSLTWANEVTNEINALLSNNPMIAILVENNGKNIKFVRKIVTRRQIV